MPIITQSSQNNEVNWDDPLNKGLVYWLKPKNLQVFSGTDGDPNADLVGIDGGVVSPSAGISLTTSEIGQVWDKQGSNYVRIRSSLPSLNGEQMTWGGWYKTTTTGESWWSNNYDATGPSSEQIIRTSNQAAGVFFRPTGWLAAPSNSTPINTWNHIIGVINVTDGYVACYVNGILSASVATGSTPITTGTQEWVIGGRADDPSVMNRSGQFGDQRWYNRALSDSEVHDLYVASRTGYRDQFKRRYFPVSTTVEEPPTEETAGGLIRLKSTSQTNEVNWDDPLNKGLVAWYPMRQKGGNVLRDVVGEYHGTLESSMTSDDWVPSPETKSLALDFDGTNDSVLIPNAVVPGITVTMCAWVRPDSDSGGIVNISRSGIGTAQESTQLNVTADNFPQVQVQEGAVILSATGPVAMVPSEWHFVVARISLEGSTKSGSIYLNGIWQASDTTTSAINLRSRTSIGCSQRRNGEITNILRGGISDVRIYDRALSESEIHDLYVASRTGYQDQFKRRYFPVSTTIEEPPTEETTGGLIRLKSTSQNNEVNWNDPLNKGLVAWYPMRQKGGNVLRDVTDYGNNGNFEVISPASSWSINSEAKSQSFQFGDDSPPTRIDVPNSDSINSACGVGQARTISFWAKTTLTTNRVIFEKGTNLHFVVQTTSSRIGFRTNETSLGNCRSDIIADGKWHFLCFTHLAGTNYAYTDGNFSEFEHETAPSANSHELQIGARDGSFPYVGGLSDVRIYNRALTESEVHDLYQASRTGYQDQFKRRYFPVSTTVEEPPAEETSGGLIRLKSPKPTQPSYAAGYAKSASESAYPELWEGLADAWVPALGNSGFTLRNIAGVVDANTVDMESDDIQVEGPYQAISTSATGGGTYGEYARAQLGRVVTYPLSATVLWKPRVADGGGFLSILIPTENDRYFALSYLSGGIVRMDTRQGSGLFEQQSGTTSVDEWHVVTACWNSITSRQLWVDGKLVLDSAATAPSVTTTDVLIGTLRLQTGAFTNDGYNASTLLHNRTLLPEEIKTLHADPLAPFRQRRSIPFGVTQAATGAYTLTADTGSFTLTGNDAALTFSAANDLVTEVGSFTLTGTATGLKSDRKLTAETGTFTLTGSDATLTYSKASTLTADTGSFTSTGNDATLRVARKTSVSTGAFTLTGTDTGLNYGAASPTLVAAVGAFTAAGNDASLVVSRKIAPETGAFTETGNDAGLRASRSFIAATGAFTLDGPATNLQVARNLVASNASFTLNGVNVLLRYSEADVSSIIQATSASIRCPKANGSISCADSDGTFITP